MQEALNADKAARVIAANVYTAFTLQAAAFIHPAKELVIVARLVEAIRPEIGSSPEVIISVANEILEAWEEGNDEVRGPRVVSINLLDGSVTMKEMH
ncbi:hypothetical protein [Methylobacterium iners]|uniref:Uncharacterized protein n=1 Tax=Methylobacterium iners TaxID=418707 RepID=A0ABQ4S4M3_9HYPH|nr:hypothetical protein [Methylobacterium iners]GJD98021.1 hypothetical protein OCOJLMKI_5260 [Methylobacterium iners]